MNDNGTITYSVKVVFGQVPPPVLTLQTGDYNSHVIQAMCYAPSGAPLSFDNANVQVVYGVNGENSPGFPVDVAGNILTFTLPSFASSAAGTHEMQIEIYGQGSYLQSAKIPYIASKALTPGTGGDDPVPALVLLVQQAEQAISECTEATNNANDLVNEVQQKLDDGDFVGPIGPKGEQGYQGIGVSGASLDDEGELVFSVSNPATGETSMLPPVNIDTSAAIESVNKAAADGVQAVQQAQSTGIQAVEEATNTGTSAIKSAQETSVQAVQQEGTTQVDNVQNAGTSAVGNVTSAQQSAVQALQQAQSSAEGAITDATNEATQTIQQESSAAVGNVQAAQSTAVQAVAQAQTSATDAVTAEGDAQVTRLQEIIPQPTAQNNGSVIAVENGSYQLASPASLVLNDSVVGSTSGWSSLQILNTLCPPFTVSGATVQCTPVANYPLGVEVEITPTQEGTGDPSPENVRPIVGWDSVNVTRCGKNFMPYSKPSPSTYTKNGITFTWNNDGSIHVIGTAVGQPDSNIMYFEDFYLPPGKYRMINPGNPGVIPQFVVKKADTGANYWYNPQNIISIENGDVPQYFYVSILDGTVADDTIYAFLSYGSDIHTGNDYAPYAGTTTTLSLPETVYGGTVDAVTGVGSEEVDIIELAVADMDNTEDFPGWRVQGWIGNYVENTNQDNIFSAAADYIASNADGKKLLRFNKNTVYFTKNGFGYTQSQIKEQYPDLVFQFAFRRLSPEPFQATGGQPILALPGTNTIYADAGNVTVTGASDPIATITALQNRASALESAALN